MVVKWSVCITGLDDRLDDQSQALLRDRSQSLSLERGMVNSSHLIDGESRQKNAMEPITATVVIIALVALAC